MKNAVAFVVGVASLAGNVVKEAWKGVKVACLGVGIGLAALAAPAQAQTTGFDTDTFVTGVDVEGQLETAMTSMSGILMYVIGAMLALGVIAAVVIWARKSLKAR